MLNNMWTSLGKTVSPDVLKNPQRYSIIPQSRPFMVPGERFREFYYWDSYWIIKGLLVCDMRETARGIILNALDLVTEFGFVPNGARIYYLNRSQPPLLSEMVYHFYTVTGDIDLVMTALPILEKEYNFWMTSRVVVMPDGHNVLNHYYTENNAPRPESYREDLNNSHSMSPSQAMEFYANVAAGAESGEDFSTRWFASGDNIQTIRTKYIIPVDLNAIMYKFESNMVNMYSLLKATPPVDYAGNMVKRKAAMDLYLWSPSAYVWYDYCLDNHTQIVRSYASNWFPLWSGAYDQGDSVLKEKTLQALLNSGLVQSGGVISTDFSSGQQWDSPNAWAPHQSLMVQSLLHLDTQESKAVAQSIAVQWIKATYIGYNESQMMHEKYNGFIPGQQGVGGEYPPQIGFGWTNGVTLEFFDMYGQVLSNF